MPKTPKAPAKRVGEPFKAGDQVLDKDEVVAETNAVSSVGGKMHYGRGITLRESRDRWQSPKQYQAMTSRMIRPPKPAITYRSLAGGGQVEAPLSEHFQKTHPSERKK